MSLRVIPYEDKYDEALRKMERGIVQGRHVQLEMLKENFLDRANVFREFNAFTVLNQEGTPIASATGARATIAVNNHRFDAGLGFDLKVCGEYRNKGIGKMVSRKLFSDFFTPGGMERTFTTIKKSNVAIRAMLPKAVGGLSYYEFVYLTIPVTARINPDALKAGDKQLFEVILFGEQEIDPSLYVNKKSGLGYFNTYKMYQLRITNVSFLYRLAIRIMKSHSSLPKIGDTLRVATLFNHTPRNILAVNEVLEELSEGGVQYLMVCCRRGDSIFRTLEKYSINTYGYFLVANFRLTQADAVTVDVRCL